jgi:hypothetical protein
VVPTTQVTTTTTAGPGSDSVTTTTVKSRGNGKGKGKGRPTRAEGALFAASPWYLLFGVARATARSRRF